MEKKLRYKGAQVDCLRHDGGLEPAVGASNYQVTRADRYRPERCEGYGWTYNHAADLTFFKGKFYVQYLSTERDEHVSPSASFICASANGTEWSAPQESFPPYEIPACVLENKDGDVRVLPGGTRAVMHQRVGFYQTGGRLLALGFYGLCPGRDHSPFDRNGIGRAVREVYEDGGMGEIFFIRHNAWAGWTPEKLNYPMYTECADAGFVRACEALLSDRLAVQQWLDEHGPDDGLLPIRQKGLSAFCWYHIDEKHVVGLWKWSKVAESFDGGETWEEPRFEPSLVMPGSKIWGERTEDGRFALVWTPTYRQNHRYPLAVATSEDGLEFDGLLCIHSEVPKLRYAGFCKDDGPQYMRGISEGHERPGDGAMWIAYSVNKEDIWVTRVPLPVRGEADDLPAGGFGGMAEGAIVDGWNVYSPLRCPVRVKRIGGEKYLELRDADSADYAKASRLFRPLEKCALKTRVLVQNTDARGEFWIELCGEKESPGAIVGFAKDGYIKAVYGGECFTVCGYKTGRWYDIEIKADCATGRYALKLNGEEVQRAFAFTSPLRSIKKVVYRTGPRREVTLCYTSFHTPAAVDVTPERDAEALEIIALVEKTEITECEGDII